MQVFACFSAHTQSTNTPRVPALVQVLFIFSCGKANAGTKIKNKKAKMITVLVVCVRDEFGIPLEGIFVDFVRPEPYLNFYDVTDKDGEINALIHLGPPRIIIMRVNNKFLIEGGVNQKYNPDFDSPPDIRWEVPPGFRVYYNVTLRRLLVYPFEFFVIDDATNQPIPDIPVIITIADPVTKRERVIGAEKTDARGKVEFLVGYERLFAVWVNAKEWAHNPNYSSDVKMDPAYGDVFRLYRKM